MVKMETERINNILGNPDLLKNIIFEVSKKVVGEEDTIKTIYLCSCGRLVENAQHTSYNLFVNDVSGVGKDWVCDKTLDILPNGTKIKRTRISPNLLNYWHNPKTEPEWDWNNKVLYLEDISNTILNHEVFKVMASSGSHATILINQTPFDIEIKGKPVIIITSASATPSPELLRRFQILNLDGSINQTKAIIKRQALLAEQGISLEYDKELIEALNFLKRIKVKVPYADKIADIITVENVLMRTQFARFLDYIKASCALCQYQRDMDKDGFFEATKEDYDNARLMIIKTSSNPFMIPLTRNDKKILEIMKDKFEEFGSIKDIEACITFISERWLRDQLDSLADNNFLIKGTIKGDKKDYIAYKFNQASDFKYSIPSWEELHV